jgi:hypothetical protein
MTSRLQSAAIPLLLTLCAAAPSLAAETPAATADAPSWAQAPEQGFPIRFSGYFWTDSGYLFRNYAQAGAYDQQAAYMQGRIVLGAEYVRSFGGLYAKARVEYLGLVNEYAGQKYEPHTLDAYIKVGTKTWDVQLGRFLAMEVYNRGQGIELYTAEEAGNKDAPPLYWVDYARGLWNEPGQAAVHWFPADWVALELAGVYGQFADQNNYYAVRPAFAAQYQNFELRFGAEELWQKPQTDADKSQRTEKGYGGSLRYSLPLGLSNGKPPRVLGPGQDDLSGGGSNCGCLMMGFDLARTSIDATQIDGITTDPKNTLDKMSFGGWVDLDFWKNSIGLGVQRTRQTNSINENNNQLQFSVSYLYRLPIEGLSVKAVYGVARAHFEDVGSRSQWENYMNSVRLRVLYEFR